MNRILKGFCRGLAGRGVRICSPRYLVLLPLLLSLLLVLFIPAIWALFISFQRYVFGRPPAFIGMENFIRIFRDPWFWNALYNNLAFTFFALIGEFLVGLGFALLLFRGFVFQKLWLSLLMSPFAISPVVAAVIWRHMLCRDVGIINYILSLAGLGPFAWLTDPVLAFGSLITINVWMSYPFIMLILYSALLSIPREQFEAPRVDGASGWQVFRYVTAPLILPAMLVGLTFRLIFVFRVFDIIWILTQGGPIRSTEVLSIYLYRHGFRHWNFGMGGAISWVMLILTMCLSIVYLRLLYKRMFV